MNDLGRLAGEPKKSLKRPGARAWLWWKGFRKQTPPSAVFCHLFTGTQTLVGVARPILHPTFRALSAAINNIPLRTYMGIVAMAQTSEPPPRTSTPRTFTNQSATAEELLKSQTVGLVNLADFRK